MTQYQSFFQSPLGTIQLQCSDEHLNMVAFCSDDSFIHSSSHSHPLLYTCQQQLEEYFNGSRQTFTLPLEQQGTHFQQTVWKLLTQIPFGITLSYRQLSAQYGSQKAIRAVAAANGKNNIAIIVPCHRVIGANQSLTGYAGGLWRKKWLLAHEAEQHRGVTQTDLFMER